MISAVILTKNEEKNIEECLENLSFCSEIIVIDDKSEDNTKNIASRYAKIHERKLNGDFASQLNFGIDKAQSEWVLFIEPDERISPELKEEILKVTTNKNSVAAYSFKRIDWFGSRWLTHGEIGAYRAFRLVKKGSGKWLRRVHQYFKTDGNTGVMKHPLKHFPHPTLREFIKNINNWSSLHAIANKEEGKKSNLTKIVIWPKMHFLKNYLCKMGFLDGVEGFLYALLMSFHSFLSWSKLYMLQKRRLKTSEIINQTVKL